LRSIRPKACEDASQRVSAHQPRGSDDSHDSDFPSPLFFTRMLSPTVVVDMKKRGRKKK
jgi:hypothetical protein